MALREASRLVVTPDALFVFVARQPFADALFMPDNILQQSRDALDASGSDAYEPAADRDHHLKLAAELKRHEREKHRFSSAGRADAQRVTDVADMDGKPELGRRAASRAKRPRR